ERINVFMAVPTIYQKLVAYWSERDSAERERLSKAARRMRLMVSGSAALPAPLFAAWEKITGHQLLERYGMTEIGMALSNPLEGERRPGTVGVPLPGCEVRLQDGRIEVRGPNVFKYYWRRPEETANSFTADGWFKTGDIAELESDGYYKILGRESQDIIKSGGYKISALEIESVLLEHPAIEEAAVVGIADDEWGECIAAAIVRKDAGTGKFAALAAEISSWLETKLARYKCPRRWKQVARLPRNAMGKVMKPQVRELFTDSKAEVE
ncbi:MAG: AMP-binding protein, partial [Bdellovibrionia bacterium]